MMVLWRQLMHLKHTFQMVHITFVSLAIDVCTEVQFLDLVANKLALEADRNCITPYTSR